MDGDREDGGCSRYKKIHSDGTELDWIPIPDPTHPCYALGENFDNHGFGIFETERYKRDEMWALSEGSQTEAPLEYALA